MIRPETLQRFGAGWETPTPDDVRELLRSQGWTGSVAANIAGVHSRTVRKWTGGEREIPYAAWRLLVMEAGLV